MTELAYTLDTAGLASGRSFGFGADNFIGSRTQRNVCRNSWISFFRDCRLAPQLQDAAKWFDAADRKRTAYLLDHLEDVLTEPDSPSLLHGDLWSGSFIAGRGGIPWLIDPAAYAGHAEAALSMAELFSGFPKRFYAAYGEVNPIQPGYGRRRDLYHLYHLCGRHSGKARRRAGNDEMLTDSIHG